MPVAYLGKKGSFASLVARQRYPDAETVSQPTIGDLVTYVKEGADRMGVVPIENSSGGIIFDTVDAFVDDSFNLFILEETRIRVRYALLGKSGQPIQTILSHYAALRHCAAWIRSTYPAVRTQPVASTSEAAAMAAAGSQLAAISTRESANEYGLDVLHFPIMDSVPNITQFFTIGHAPVNYSGSGGNTSLVATLDNSPGSLFRFLKPFHDLGVNLNRIQSRTIPGDSSACKFFVGLEGVESETNVGRAIELARPLTVALQLLGSYPRLMDPYES
ncbi:MAG TPA: prephenate dehydratase domain-containing protein [Leptospiraceae bacterium]|nr:hypothetical protein [Leptospirales bacterium]HMU85280.1 prephenate dehydratase domain-containing protein [Leptospiraceae bacterium]HMX56308.1 prephenate dehydratase domain-containing protein [Leptospiraceae bacterium]HMY46266.1 prephenate dehydratase domain-containing protein [Leptospiraceae bacterium]HMZ37952.1 prephenate dehydratase domain-containing protein [Leptospiraceae bacterium]